MRARVELWIGYQLIYTWRDVEIGRGGGMILQLGRDPTVEVFGALARAFPFEAGRL